VLQAGILETISVLLDGHQKQQEVCMHSSSPGLFSTTGRRNRFGFWLCHMYWVGAFAIGAGLVFVLGMVVELNHADMGFFYVVGLLAGLVFLVSALCLASQRCRDIGWSGWFALLVLLPYVGSLFHIALFLIPGTVGPNKFGPAAPAVQ
jgi:uncharacterized membrane protein YhaH (DUF805 family)